MQLAEISRATLARRMTKWQSPKGKGAIPRQKPGSRLRSEVPMDRYNWNENRPGALEVDLVEHNGGSSLGHFAYTLSVVDVVTGYSRRRAVLGRGQAGVHQELVNIVNCWPFKPWALHTDNGSEFLNAHLIAFAKQYKLFFTRSRPYRKNDNAHVEQKNRQYVREIVGYDRYDTPEDVHWLNQVYAILDPYVNLFLPLRKVIFKQRRGAHVQKRYDQASTPFQRLQITGILCPETQMFFEDQFRTLNPLSLHRDLECLITKGPTVTCQKRASAVSWLG
jgi:transposase InsO family protein